MLETAPFTLDLKLDSKAVSDDDDHFYIEGYASDFNLDRQDEAFEPGAFAKSIERFLGTNPALLYHHDYGRQLGVVENLELRPDGLFMRARVDHAEPGTENADVVRKVRKGTIKGLSVGGLFKRRKGPDGKARIFDADLAEVSITPMPVNPRTLFAVAQKAFESDAATGGGEQLVLDWFEQQFDATEKAFERVERQLSS